MLRVALLLLIVLFTTSAIAQDDSPQAQQEVSTAAASQPPSGDDALKQLGKLMQRDWKDRPEWADMAAALLSGQPMGPGMGWWKSSKSRYDWKWLSDRYDADKDGVVSKKELGDQQAHFVHLDRDGNRKLEARDFDWSRRRRGNPESQFAMQLFYLWDSDSNGKISKEELNAFFDQADRDEVGYLTETDLATALNPPPPERPAEATAEYQPGRNVLDDLEMLMAGEFGSLTSGPAINDPAPDFSLPLQDESGVVTLSQLRGKPVVLVFGSFT